MNQPIGELSPPFEIAEPASWRAPIIFNSPHSGSVYPPEFVKASRIDMAALRRSEDSFMDGETASPHAAAISTIERVVNSHEIEVFTASSSPV